MIADGFLVAPGQPDLGGPLGTDAGDLDQPLALLLDDVEHGLAERLDQLLRIDRADALDQPEPRYFSMPPAMTAEPTSGRPP